MNCELYCGTIIPAREAADGESPTYISVTRENNGTAIWRASAEEGIVCVKIDRYALEGTMIEEAVSMVLRERALAKKAA
jgi:hypothetical protein